MILFSVEWNRSGTLFPQGVNGLARRQAPETAIALRNVHDPRMAATYLTGLYGGRCAAYFFVRNRESSMTTEDDGRDALDDAAHRGVPADKMGQS
jgi:hypothetical protein